MKAFYNVGLATIRLWLREPLTVFLSLGLLAMMMVLFSTMGNDTSNYQIRVGVVAAPATYSGLAGRFKQDGTLRAIPVADISSLEDLLRRGKLGAGIVSEQAAPGRMTVLVPAASSEGWTKVGTEHLLQVLDPTSVGLPNGLEVRRVAAPHISSRFIDFLFPGILALAVLQTCLGSAVVFLDARRIGVLRRFRITPVQPSIWSMGFLSGRCAIVVIHLAVLIGTAKLFFHVHTRGNAMDATLACGVGTICFLAFSGVVALMAPSVESGALIVQLLNFPMSFLCGVFFRNDGLPPMVGKFVDVLPFTYMVNLMRDILQLGLPLRALHHDFGGLLIWTAAALLLLALTSRYHSRALI